MIAEALEAAWLVASALAAWIVAGVVVVTVGLYAVVVAGWGIWRMLRAAWGAIGPRRPAKGPRSHETRFQVRAELRAAERRSEPRYEKTQRRRTVPARELPPGDWRLRVYGRGPTNGTDRRRQPRIAERARLIAQQGNRCLYCEIPIGTIITRRGKDVVLRLNWDHFVPYAYVARNPRDNWVLACHVCNGIKRGRIFKTVQEVRDSILPERLDKGYEDPLDVIRRLGDLPRLNPFPDRLRAASGDVVHFARTSKPGFWETACGVEKAASSWRTPGGALTGRACERCVIATGIAVATDELDQPA